jgi:hypothetical protein
MRMTYEAHQFLLAAEFPEGCLTGPGELFDVFREVGQEIGPPRTWRAVCACGWAGGPEREAPEEAGGDWRGHLPPPGAPVT